MADETLLALVADIVSAQVSHNSVSANDLPALIQSVYVSLAKLGEAQERLVAAIESMVTGDDWQRMLAVGNSVGLVEGAEWRTFPDWPHFQLTGKWPVTPDDEVRQVFLDGGMLAVWEQGGLEGDGQ
jgi:predicted transcriptional regulator